MKKITVIICAVGLFIIAAAVTKAAFYYIKTDYSINRVRLMEESEKACHRDFAERFGSTGPSGLTAVEIRSFCTCLGVRGVGAFTDDELKAMVEPAIIIAKTYPQFEKMPPWIPYKVQTTRKACADEITNRWPGTRVQ